MSIRLVIAGAGGFGRGVRGWVLSSPQYLKQHLITSVVFIDDGEYSKDLPIISDISSYQPVENDRVLCAIANPATRKKVVSDLGSRGARFHSFVDDRAVLGRQVSIAEGAIICPGVVISANAVIGKHAQINFNCSIGHDVQLGAYSTLSPAVALGGELVVLESSFFGANATVLPRLTLGEEVTVGAGSVVLRSVDSRTTVVGNPARILERR